MLQVLRVKPFLFLWLAQVFSQISLNMLNFVLLLHIANLTHSNTADSLFIIAISVPAVIFGNIAGVVVEYFHKKQILLICNILRIITAFMFLFYSDTLFWLYSLAIVTSVITQFFVPAEAPFIPEIVPQKLLVSANSLFTLTFYSSVVVGFMLAGPAISFLGIGNVFILTAFLYLVAAICTHYLPGDDMKHFFIRLNSITHRMESIDTAKIVIRRLFTDIKDGYTLLRENKLISGSMTILIASQVFIATISALSPGYALTVLNINIADASLVIVAPAVIGMIIGSVSVGLIKTGISKNKIINISILFSGLLLTLLSFLSREKLRTHIGFDYFIKVDILQIAVVILFLLGFLNSVITVYANTILQNNTDFSNRSRIYGIMISLGGLMLILPVLTAGILSDLFGVVKVLLAMGTGVVVYSIYKFALKRSFI